MNYRRTHILALPTIALTIAVLLAYAPAAGAEEDCIIDVVCPGIAEGVTVADKDCDGFPNEVPAGAEACYTADNCPWAANPDQADEDGDGKGDACERRSCIAASLLGEEDPRLDDLRAFRDDVLAKSDLGIKLIDLYYGTSEDTIAILEKNPPLKQSAAEVLETIITVDITSQARRQTETDSGGDSDGGSCAAAHVMGKANPNLNILRAFRDDILTKSAIGSKLIKVYYTAGDAMIGYLDKHPRAKKAAANLLNRLSK